MNPPWRSIRGRQIKLLCADHGARHVVGLTGFRTSAARREVTAFADEVTILRRGKLAGYGRVADLQLYAPQSVDEVSPGTRQIAGWRIWRGRESPYPTILQLT